jgi:O-antigen ligase
MTYLQLFGMVLIISDLYSSTQALHVGLQTYVLGAYLGIANTIYSYCNASEFYYHRYSGAGFHVNDLGLILALGIPVAWYLTLVENHGKASAWLKLINYIYIPAAVWGIILTGSRSALLAAAPGLLYALWSLSRLKPCVRVLLLGTLTASVLVLPAIIPQTSLQRLAATTTEISEGDWNGRLGIWREGLGLFAEHPFLGVGSGAFRSAAVEAGKLAHNFAISLLAEVGIIGLTLFGIILTMAVCHAIGQPLWRRRLWLAVLMAWFIGAVSHNWEHRKQTWLFLSLVIAGATHSVQRIRPFTGAINET